MAPDAPSTDSAPVAVVTGGSAGVGRATVCAFARRGWRVAVLARGREGVDAACRDVERLGAQALPLYADMADADAVEAAAAEVERRWGGIDAWVNNAMATIYAPSAEVSVADFRRATEVTYLGAVWGTQAALRRMRARGRGVVVQVGSALAYRSIPLQAPYCAAKAALRGYTDSLRSELIHEGSAVRLTMVQLSAFNTPQFDWGKSHMPCKAMPVPPVFQPELAAEAIVHAALHDRREWWVGWPAVKAILAQHVVPGFADRMLALQGFKGQQADEPRDPAAPDNLHTPVPGDRGAHGRFDAIAKRRSVQWWLSSHRRAFVPAALGLLAATALLLALT
jgi:NAD(P)-dependent dehydrogenase (short-subunit alcohol dehydrogenase family)